MKKEKLLIIGAGGHGKVVADIAMKMKKWSTIRFLDGNKEISSSMGIEVIGKPEDALSYIEDNDIFVGIGNNSVREKIQSQLDDSGATIPTLIHPSSTIGSDVTIERGTVVMAGSIINCSTDIGRGCIINTGSTIDHDNIIGSYAHISPGVNIAGTVNIGNKTWLGIGSIIKNNINITHNCKIGAGAVVVKDIKETGVYIGIPAKRQELY